MEAFVVILDLAFTSIYVEIDIYDLRHLRPFTSFTSMYGTIYGTINLTIHHYGIHNSGGRRRRPPLLWRRPEAASIMVDGEIYGAIYGTI